MSTTVTPARMRAGTPGPLSDFWYDTSGFMLGTSTASGVRMNAELALTLSAVWRAVSGITADFSTLPCQIFQYRDDGGKERARNHPLAYLLRWQPNTQQTAQQFFAMIVGHQLLRGNAYVEIVRGLRGFAGQLIPRHPDRVIKERLPNGGVRYKLLPIAGQSSEARYLGADEMVHFPDLLTFDGWLGASRISYGMQSFGGMLAAEQASQSFFVTGCTAGVVATHKGSGDLGEEELKNLHTSLSLYASGSKNMGGILLVEEDMAIQRLGIEPEKAQLLATRQYSVKEIARWFNYPGHKLEAESQTQAYAAREQANLEYVMGCIRPLAIAIEQVIQKDLILDKEEYFSEFLLEALFRGDMKSQSEFFTAMIRNRVMNPNEVRLRQNLNPYDGGEEYCPWNTASAADNGSAARSGFDGKGGAEARSGADRRTGAQADIAEERRSGLERRTAVRTVQMALQNAQRIARKEMAVVTKLAERHASDVQAWHAALVDFYDGHTDFVAETMLIPKPIARDYTARHGLALQQTGILAMEDWEWMVPTELAELALTDHFIVAESTHIQMPTQAPPVVNVTTPPVTFEKGAMSVDARTTVEAPRVDVKPAAVTIARGAVQTDVHLPPQTKSTKKIARNPKGQIVEIQDIPEASV